jgi:hypothetical protein
VLAVVAFAFSCLAGVGGTVFLVDKIAIAIDLPDISIGTKIGMLEGQPYTVVTEVIGSVAYFSYELDGIHEGLATGAVDRLVIRWE